MYAQAISRWSLTGTVHSNGSRCRQCLNGMIMQNPLDDDGIFGDFVNATPSYALDEADAPVADWRFLPQRVGQRQLRIDIAHTETTATPGPQQNETCDTLYFG